MSKQTNKAEDIVRFSKVLSYFNARSYQILCKNSYRMTELLIYTRCPDFT